MTILPSTILNILSFNVTNGLMQMKCLNVTEHFEDTEPVTVILRLSPHAQGVSIVKPTITT